MKRINSYNDFLNEKWFSRKKDKPKRKPMLSMEDYDKMTPEEFEENKKELYEEGKRLDAKNKINKQKRREDFKDMDDALRLQLKSFLNKKYKFQYDQVIWRHKSSNYQEIDIAEFEFIDINIEPIFDWNSGKMTDIFFILTFKDRYNHLIEINFNNDSPTDKKLDLEYDKPIDRNFKAILHGDYGHGYSDINYEDPNIYPHRGGSVDLVPSEYQTYQLLSELKDIMEQLNKDIKLKTK